MTEAPFRGIQQKPRSVAEAKALLDAINTIHRAVSDGTLERTVGDRLLAQIEDLCRVFERVRPA